MKEIALIVPSLAIGGAERVVVTLANGLADRGWRVDLVTAVGGGALVRNVAPSVSVTDLGAGRVAWSLRPLMRFLARRPRAVVLSAITHMNVVSLLATRVFGHHQAPVFVQEVALFSRGREAEPKLRAALTRALMRQVYQRADAVICVSRSVAEEVAEQLDGHAPPIETLPNPVDLAAVRRGAAMSPPHHWMTRENRQAAPVLVSVGRLALEKGIDLLLHSLARLRRQGGTHRLLLVGDGPARRPLTALVDELGLADAVEFVGSQENPWAYMAHSDACVFASPGEGFGLVLVEAMACGTQVVSTRSSSAAEEILDDGRLGEMVPPGDPEALAAAIGRALASPRDPRLLELQARRFDSDRLVDDYARLLERGVRSHDYSEIRVGGRSSHPAGRSQWKEGGMNTAYYDTPLDLENAAEQAIARTDVVLDIGCGIRPMTTFQPRTHICVEPFDRYVEILRKRFHSEPGVVVLKRFALDALQMLADRSVDSVFLLDVIEHMTKDAGLEVLKECERVARRQIVVCTPLGFMPQEYEVGEIDGWGVAHNMLQEHLSGWEPADFPAGWSFKICNSYHTIDAKGQPLSKPFGVLYAFRDFPPDRPALSSAPLLVGATLPPALVGGRLRSNILELLSVYDPASMGVASSYDGRPYSPLHNIPNLPLFCTQRLDCTYYPIVWPTAWPRLGSSPPSVSDLDGESQAFLNQWLQLSRAKEYRSIVLCDFGVEEVAFARYMAEALGLKVIVLDDGQDYRISPDHLALLPRDTERVDLAAGLATVRRRLEPSLRPGWPGERLYRRIFS